MEPSFSATELQITAAFTVFWAIVAYSTGWNDNGNRIFSTINATVVTVSAIIAGRGAVSEGVDLINGHSDLTMYVVLSFFGYLIVDMIWQFYGRSKFDLTMVIHHLFFGFCCYAYARTPTGDLFICMALSTELSTIFMHLRILTPRCEPLCSFLFALSFLVQRVLLIPFTLLFLYEGDWNPYSHRKQRMKIYCWVGSFFLQGLFTYWFILIVKRAINGPKKRN